MAHEHPSHLLTTLSGVVSSVGFGLYQLFVETDNIHRGVTGAKFPQGFASLNPLEEFLEGSISTAIGSMVAFALIYGFEKRNHLDRNLALESITVYSGALVGYIGMMIAGSLLHASSGVPDVKWGPFK